MYVCLNWFARSRPRRPQSSAVTRPLVVTKSGGQNSGVCRASLSTAGGIGLFCYAAASQCSATRNGFPKRFHSVTTGKCTDYEWGLHWAEEYVRGGHVVTGGCGLVTLIILGLKGRFEHRWFLAGACARHCIHLRMFGSTLKRIQQICDSGPVDACLCTFSAVPCRHGSGAVVARPASAGSRSVHSHRSLLPRFDWPVLRCQHVYCLSRLTKGRCRDHMS